MIIQGINTSAKEVPYFDPRLEDLRDKMTDQEKSLGMVKAYEIKVIEPGADEAYTFRLPAANLTLNLDDVLFMPVEIEARGLNARGFVKNGQATRSVEADTITFQAIGIRALDRKELMEFNARRQRIASEEQAKKDKQAEDVKALRKSIEDRIAKLTGGNSESKSGK